MARISLRKTVRNALPNLSEWVLNRSIVENRVLQPRYERYRRAHRADQPALQASDRAIVDELERCGRCVTSLDRLAIPGGEAFVRAGDRLFQTLEERHPKTAQKTATKFQTIPDFGLLDAHREVFQWGLCDRLLAIAENYIGLPVAYDTCLCNISVANGLETATRRWHLDNEDRRVLKVIIYFSDVEPGGGPFESLDPDSSRQILAGTGDRCAFFQSPAFGELLAARAPMATPQAVTGAKGAAIFVDTAKVYHRGQPPTTRSRHAISFGYCSRRPQRPFRCGRNQLERAQLERLAIGLGNAQKDCIFWKDNLPAIARRIPTYFYG